MACMGWAIGWAMGYARGSVGLGGAPLLLQLPPLFQSPGVSRMNSARYCEVSGDEP